MIFYNPFANKLVDVLWVNTVITSVRNLLNEKLLCP